MNQVSKIWIITRAYNAEKTIGRAIESVLNQTYVNFNYLIRDNGSTDGTYSICQKYAARDNRIRLVHNDINHKFISNEDYEAKSAEEGLTYGTELNECDYFCVLDADDEYYPNFFQDAINFAKKNELDIVACGTEMIMEEMKTKVGQVYKKNDIIIENAIFSEFFPEYHWHMRQQWGKLLKKNVLTGIEEYLKRFFEVIKSYGIDSLYYGIDTIINLYSFRRADKIGILSGIDHKYYIQNRSLSTSFQKGRIESDWILHRETEKYLLDKCGCVSRENKEFLSRVYANAFYDTTQIIKNSDIPVRDKLRKYKCMAEHSITKECFSFKESLAVCESKRNMLNIVFEFCSNASAGEVEDICVILISLAPNCAEAVTPECIDLICNKPDLQKSIIDDDATEFVSNILEMIRINDQVNKYDLYGLVQRMSKNDIILNEISDKNFLDKYGNIYIMIKRKQYDKALNSMTEILFDNESGINDTFFWVYSTLAALLEKVDEFISGKLYSARYFLKNRRYEECRQTLNDLTEMGIEDNEEIASIKRELAENGK